MYAENVESVDRERNIPGYPGYTCNRNGDVFSYKNRKRVMMTKRLTDHGYYTVCLSHRNKDKHFRIHILVARIFIGPKPKGCDRVNHKDTNKLNNHVDNLEWCDAGHNVRHACENDLIKRRVKPVVQATLDGRFIAEFPSIAQAAEQTGYDARIIANVAQKTIQRSGDCTWYYKHEFIEGKPIKERKFGRPVLQYDVDGNFIAEHEHGLAAEEATGANSTSISRACNGKLNKAGGFVWKFKEVEKKPKKTHPEETDEWMKHQDWPTYRVASDGRIYSENMYRFLDAKIDTCGRMFYSIKHSSGKTKRVTRYRLVALCYIPNPEEKPVVNHKDGNPSNDDVSNLEWATKKEDVEHIFKMRTSKSVIPVDLLDEDGIVVASYDSIAHAHRETGFCQRKIKLVLDGKSKGFFVKGKKNTKK